MGHNARNGRFYPLRGNKANTSWHSLGACFRMSLPIAAVISAFIAFSSTELRAASFDCSQMANQIEKLICADIELSILDEKLAAAYKRALDAPATNEPLKRQQREWLYTRDACTTATCLKKSYEARLLQFTDARYKLVNGNGVEVCEAYQANLNSFNAAEPMLCERKIDTGFEALTGVEWKQLDLWENRELYWNLKNFLENIPEHRAMGKEDEEWIRRRSREKLSPQLFLSRVDIDNDGHPDRVLMYKNGICGQAVRTFSTALAVQREDTPHIDLERTKLLLQNSYREEGTGKVLSAPFGYLYNMYGIFRHRNDTYFDKANARPTERDLLQVYSITDGHAKLVCGYHFTRN